LSKLGLKKNKMSDKYCMSRIDDCDDQILFINFLFKYANIELRLENDSN